MSYQKFILDGLDLYIQIQLCALIFVTQDDELVRTFEQKLRAKANVGHCVLSKE